MSTTTKIDVRTWDAKRDTFNTYQFKLSAYAAIKKILNALNKNKMANCIGHSVYNSHVASRTKMQPMLQQ
jgi:hypothetical protein